MSIIAVFEGPKGIGKSTILNRLLSHEYADQIRAFSGQWEHLLTEDVLVHDNASNIRYIHDRGMLSHFIYTFLMPSDPDFNRVRYNGSKIEISSWRMPNIKMIEDYLNRIEDNLYILYTEDVSLLKSRINKRNAEIGKGATDEEWKVLEQSNFMFKQMGSFLKSEFPDKIKLIKIDENTKLDDLITLVINKTALNPTIKLMQTLVEQFDKEVIFNPDDFQKSYNRVFEMNANSEKDVEFVRFNRSFLYDVFLKMISLRGYCFTDKCRAIPFDLMRHVIKNCPQEVKIYDDTFKYDYDTCMHQICSLISKQLASLEEMLDLDEREFLEFKTYKEQLDFVLDRYLVKNDET